MLGVFLLMLPLVAQERAGQEKTNFPLSGGWEVEGRLELSFASARNHMRSRFEGKGFLLRHEIEMGKHRERCLMLWEKEGRQFIVMLWRMDVNQTGYSIGEIKDDKK